MHTNISNRHLIIAAEPLAGTANASTTVSKAEQRREKRKQAQQDKATQQAQDMEMDTAAADAGGGLMPAGRCIAC